MNFFALQDKARKQTRFLVFLFVLAVLAIGLTVNLIFFISISAQSSQSMTLSEWLAQPYWLYISGATLGLIFGASLWRSWQLQATPNAIAKMVNATPVSLSTKDRQERVLVNVVEEMSIASGMPIPKIFIMREESGINAFVAGLEPSQVSLVVTQGLLETLNRQELQGVIAHEYSHVFHGDMRINVRLIGVLAGILIIGQLGGLLLRSGGYRGRSISRSSNNKSSGNAGAVMLIGIGLFAVGYIGLFFGRLIKAAISRQREFLADASAVQYTRDKDGIASALNQIANHQGHSQLDTEKAEEMSHLCFAESIKQSFTSMLATHPPIADRIKAINPGFNRFQKSQISANADNKNFTQQSTSNVEQDIIGSQFSQSSEAKPSLGETVSVKSDSIISHIGEVSSQQVISAQMLLASIPAELKALAHAEQSSKDCYQLVFSLLKANQNNQTKINISNNPLIEKISLLSFKQQHCLLDICLAKIEQLRTTDNKKFVASLAKLVSTDNSISLTEFMIYASAVKRALPSVKSKSTINRFTGIKNEMILFFNLLYQQSQLTQQEKQKQFDRQLKSFGIGLKNNASYLLSDKNLNAETLNIKTLSVALTKIARLNPLLKGDFFASCIEIIDNDGEITQDEYELLRILGEYLDSPLPLSV